MQVENDNAYEVCKYLLMSMLIFYVNVNVNFSIGADISMKNDKIPYGKTL